MFVCTALFAVREVPLAHIHVVHAFRVWCGRFPYKYVACVTNKRKLIDIATTHTYRPPYRCTGTLLYIHYLCLYMHVCIILPTPTYICTCIHTHILTHDSHTPTPPRPRLHVLTYTRANVHIRRNAYILSVTRHIHLNIPLNIRTH